MMDKEFKSDGCSMFPDGAWGGCCVQHDRAYWRGGSALDRLRADIDLMECVANRGHVFIAVIMFIGVRIGGSPYLPLPWRWGFGWKYKKSYCYKKQNSIRP